MWTSPKASPAPSPPTPPPGRNRVVGALNGVTVNATLVPVGRKGQRLYVNSGMRSAARTGVGDTVRFDLHPTREEDVAPSEDLAAALAAQHPRLSPPAPASLPASAPARAGRTAA